MNTQQKNWHNRRILHGRDNADKVDNGGMQIYFLALEMSASLEKKKREGGGGVK